MSHIAAHSLWHGFSPTSTRVPLSKTPTNTEAATPKYTRTFRLLRLVLGGQLGLVPDQHVAVAIAILVAAYNHVGSRAARERRTLAIMSRNHEQAITTAKRATHASNFNRT